MCYNILKEVSILATVAYDVYETGEGPVKVKREPNITKSNKNLMRLHSIFVEGAMNDDFEYATMFLNKTADTRKYFTMMRELIKLLKKKEPGISVYEITARTIAMRDSKSLLAYYREIEK